MKIKQKLILKQINKVANEKKRGVVHINKLYTDAK